VLPWQQVSLALRVGWGVRASPQSWGDAECRVLPARVGKKDENRFQKKMNEVQRRQKGSTARAAAPSIEGRGITL